MDKQPIMFQTNIFNTTAGIQIIWQFLEFEYLYKRNCTLD